MLGDQNKDAVQGQHASHAPTLQTASQEVSHQQRVGQRGQHGGVQAQQDALEGGGRQGQAQEGQPGIAAGQGGGGGGVKSWEVRTACVKRWWLRTVSHIERTARRRCSAGC